MSLSTSRSISPHRRRRPQHRSSPSPIIKHWRRPDSDFTYFKINELKAGNLSGFLLLPTTGALWSILKGELRCFMIGTSLMQRWWSYALYTMCGDRVLKDFEKL